MGKKEPTILELALLEQAKGLYFEFRTVLYISNQTGLKEGALKKLIYGPRGHMNPSTDSWFYERSFSNSEEFLELSSRNRWLAHHFTAKALHETYEGIRAIDKRVTRRKVIGADGKPQFIEERRFLTPQEMKYINDTVSTLDKLMRLSEGLPTDIIEIGQNAEQGPVIIPGGPTNIVLDMDRVARALKLDPAMKKLIEGAEHGHNRAGIRHEGLQTDRTGEPPGGEPETITVPSHQPGSGGTNAATGFGAVDATDLGSEQPGGVSEPPRSGFVAQQPVEGMVVTAVSEVIEPGPEIPLPGGRARKPSKMVERTRRVVTRESKEDSELDQQFPAERVDVVVRRNHNNDAELERDSLRSQGAAFEAGGGGTKGSSVDLGSDEWSEPSGPSDPFADEYS